MKLVLLFATLFSFSTLVYADDNGAYTQCKSYSGRTILTMGTVGSSSSPQTVELKIDGKSLGTPEIESEVMLIVKDNGVLKFVEADHEATDWVTVRMGADGRTGRILSGLDPRTAQPLTFQIDLRCEVVSNPL